jgi:hypothetical protein
MVLMGFLLGGLTKPPPGVTANEIRLFTALVRTLSVGGNPIAQLFFAVGAAAIFAVEYRYSGWRHLVPRAARERLMLAKFAAFTLAAALSLLLAGIGDVIVTMVVPLIQGLKPVMADAPPDAAAILILAFLVSLAQLLALGGMVALVAVATRSGMAAILIPFLLSLGAAGAGAYLGASVQRIPWPGYAADLLRDWLMGEGPSPWLPALTLIGWIAASFGAAILIFRRQDLVSE